MLSKIKIDPENIDVYDLSAFGLDAQMICVPGMPPEIWDSENCWKVISYSVENFSISILSADSIVAKTIQFSPDDFDALMHILLKFMDAKTVFTGPVNNESEPVFSIDIE